MRTFSDSISGVSGLMSAFLQSGRFYPGETPIFSVRFRPEAATHPLIVDVCFRVTRHVISFLESPHVTIADQYRVEIGPDTRRQTRGIRNHQSMLASKRNGQS